MFEPTRKWRLRLSLRMLLALVLGIGFVMGWQINRAHTQAKVVQALGAMNCEILYDFQFTGERMNGRLVYGKATTPSAPRWLRNQFGDEMFQEVTQVAFRYDPPPEAWPSISRLDHLIALDVNHESSLERISGLRSLTRLKIIQLSARSRDIGVDDASLDEFGAIPNLEEFETSSVELTDDGLRRLARAQSLVRIHLLSPRRLTDAGVAHLARLHRLRFLQITLGGTFTGKTFTDRSYQSLAPILPNLEWLVLSPATITDRGMAELKVCTNLQGLTLDGPDLTAAGLAELRGLAHLKNLTLKGPKIGDAGITHLAELKNLETLNLTTSLTGAGLAKLRGLSNLKALSLDSPEIGDAEIAYLADLKNLETLNLGTSKLTDAGIAYLADLKNLETLNLGTSQLTDAGLSHVRKMLRLKTFRLNSLPSGGVTTEGIAALRTDMPSLVIKFSQWVLPLRLHRAKPQPAPSPK